MNYMALLAIVFAASVGQLLLKLSVSGGEASHETWPHRYLNLLLNPYFILGMSLYAGTSIAWMWVLRTYPLSRAYPILALTFAVVPMLAWAFLGERISPTTVLGIVMILIGISIIGLRA